MADVVILKLTLVHGSKKYPVELPINGSDEGPTVEDLSNLATQLTEVPRGSQRLIFKGHSLTDFTQPLKSLGIKKGSKIMLIGKKFDPLDEENMKVILAAEKNADDIEKRLTENIEEVQGIEKGFLQPELAVQALEKLARKIQAISEEFMKTIESLDALLIDSQSTTSQRKKEIFSSADSTFTGQD
ncbi:BAG molecular chaperone regulator 1 [Desmophyllum pertusum]|uniref:BAG molecular chaperone regulator 1 n=1 Tax=Desmophyllum pertusum TaxID=174260 RepID=A0A9X0CGM1_9CNID|nr:BAG molecular chaperone regulator 1 [Desmophyllum pertusum]